MKRIVLALSVMAVLGVGSLASAGAFGGPRLFLGEVVLGRDTNFAHVHFNGGQIACVELDGYGASDLDLVVRDSYGNLIAMDDNYSDDGYVSFYVPYSQTYTIFIVNHGYVTNVFDLATN
jgi:hypothetical protein